MADIPERSRRLVRERSMDQCSRCGNRGSDWHHRRRRRVKGHDPHCPCNGVWLCRTDHDWVHAHPTEARELGFIVSAHEDEPSSVPIATFVGLAYFTCSGEIRFSERASDGP